MMPVMWDPVMWDPALAGLIEVNHEPASYRRYPSRRDMV